MFLKRELLLLVVLIAITGCTITKTKSEITAQEGIKVIKKEKLGLTGWKEVNPDK